MTKKLIYLCTIIRDLEKMSYELNFVLFNHFIVSVSKKRFYIMWGVCHFLLGVAPQKKNICIYLV